MTLPLRDVLLSKHVLERMVERKISPDRVLSAVNGVPAEMRGRLVMICDRVNARVVIDAMADTFVVVSVYPLREPH